MVTLANHWDQFTKDEREFLLYAINRHEAIEKPLFMGKLPFVSANYAYEVVSSFPPALATLESYKHMQSILIKLNHYRPLIRLTRDWKAHV